MFEFTSVLLPRGVAFSSGIEHNARLIEI